MIAYVDTSCLVKLVIEEEGSDRMATVWTTATALVSATLVVVEARAALAAAHRGGRLAADQHAAAKGAFDALLDELHLVAVTDALVLRAGDLAESEALRGYDAVHLAAALDVGATVMCSADADLCDAARRNGMHVADLLAAP